LDFGLAKQVPQGRAAEARTEGTTEDNDPHLTALTFTVHSAMLNPTCQL